MLVCTLIYMLVAATAVGALPYTSFAKSPEPLALILREMGRPGVAQIIGAAAVIALPTVILAFLFGQTRIFLVMARDGFLPRALAKISKRGTPTQIIMVTAIIVAVIAGLLPLDEIAALANAGTLIAFISVGVCLLVMRRRDPTAKRPFRVSAVWLVGGVTILGCAYLFFSLPSKTQIWFVIWNSFGLLVYLFYGRARSLANN
jgi:basic amino acid/polyamine antiporter, APA family